MSLTPRFGLEGGRDIDVGILFNYICTDVYIVYTLGTLGTKDSETHFGKETLDVAVIFSKSLRVATAAKYAIAFGDFPT